VPPDLPDKREGRPEQEAANHKGTTTDSSSVLQLVTISPYDDDDWSDSRDLNEHDSLWSRDRATVEMIVEQSWELHYTRHVAASSPACPDCIEYVYGLAPGDWETALRMARGNALFWMVRNNWRGYPTEPAPESPTGGNGLAPLVRLDKFLEIPDEDVAYRIEGLWPTGGRIVLAAPHKAGKTTLNGNLIRSLVDGDNFLDAFPVKATAGRLVLIDNESSEQMLRRWLREHNILNPDRVEVVSLRGKLSTFNILNSATRSRWAEHIGPADVLLFDCLRPVLDALGMNEDKEAGRFLTALDELTGEAGIPETALTHHMGHVGERARGDSAILGWPEALWKVVKVAEDDDASEGSAPRYFSAYGRDVDVPEDLLQYDPTTRRLTATGNGNRRKASTGNRVEALVPAVVTYVLEHPTCSQKVLEENVTGRREEVRQAAELAAERGLITRTKIGKGWSHMPPAPDLAHLAPTSPGANLSTSPTSPIGARSRSSVNDLLRPGAKYEPDREAQ
jgi:hypothetical protein